MNRDLCLAFLLLHVNVGQCNPTSRLTLYPHIAPEPCFPNPGQESSCLGLTPRLVKYRPVQLCVCVAPGTDSISTDLAAGKLAQGSPNLLEAMD